MLAEWPVIKLKTPVAGEEPVENRINVKCEKYSLNDGTFCPLRLALNEMEKNGTVQFEDSQPNPYGELYNTQAVLRVEAPSPDVSIDAIRNEQSKVIDILGAACKLCKTVYAFTGIDYRQKK